MNNLIVSLLLSICVVNAACGTKCEHKYVSNKSQEIGYSNDNKKNGINVHTLYGAATYNNQTCDQGLQIYGSLNGTNSKFLGLEIHGSTTLTGSDVNGFSIFKGPLTAKSTTFNQSVESSSNISAEKTSFKQTIITSGDLKLKDTVVKDIFVQDSDRWTTAKIILEGNTVVNGTITFASGKGEVQVRDTALTKGKISGATLIIKK